MEQQPQLKMIVGLLVAVGALTVLRELLDFADRIRLAAALDDDPEGPARGAESYLREREEKE